MRPSEALARHRAALRALCARHGVERPRIYGSALTGTDTDDSDLDLLVEGGQDITLFTLARLEEDAERLMGTRVSVLTPGFLPRKFRDAVLARAEPL